MNECLFSSRMSLASLYNHLCDFQSENVFQMLVMLRGKAIFDIQAMILLKNRRFDEKSVTKSTIEGTHRETHIYLFY